MMTHIEQAAMDTLFPVEEYEVEVTPKVDVTESIHYAIIEAVNEAGQMVLEKYVTSEDLYEGYDGYYVMKYSAYAIVNALLAEGVVIHWDDERITEPFE